MVESATLNFGEKRYISIQVKSVCGHKFEITKPIWKLKCGDEVEDHGECIIRNNNTSKIILSALIKPKRKNATYILEYDYRIEPELLIKQVKIRVT